ncbi:hypothetical protein M3J09_007328 [Ascochyta lentis]
MRFFWKDCENPTCSCVTRLEMHNSATRRSTREYCIELVVVNLPTVIDISSQASSD